MQRDLESIPRIDRKKYSQICLQMRLMMFLYIQCTDIQVILQLSLVILAETTHQLLVGRMMATQSMVHMDIPQEMMFSQVLDFWNLDILSIRMQLKTDLQFRTSLRDSSLKIISILMVEILIGIMEDSVKQQNSLMVFMHISLVFQLLVILFNHHIHILLEMISDQELSKKISL